MKKFSLKADYAIKELFAHEKVRRQFLSDVLGIPLEEIKSVRIANPFLRKFFRKQKQGNAVDDWIRLFNAQSEEEVDMIAVKSEGMREAVEVVREMGLIRTLRWIYDDYWKAKRDRWAEDEYVRDEGIAIGRAEGKIECILQLLRNIDTQGELSPGLEERIRTERDEALLEKWHLSAARAETVGQFCKVTGL